MLVLLVALKTYIIFRIALFEMYEFEAPVNESPLKSIQWKSKEDYIYYVHFFIQSAYFIAVFGYYWF